MEKTQANGRIEFYTKDPHIASLFNQYLDEIGILDKGAPLQEISDGSYEIFLYEGNVFFEYEPESFFSPEILTYDGIYNEEIYNVVADFLVRIPKDAMRIDDIRWCNSQDLFELRYKAEGNGAFKKSLIIAGALAQNKESAFSCCNIGSNTPLVEEFFARHSEQPENDGPELE